MVGKRVILAAAAAAGLLASVPAAAVQEVFARIELLDADRNFSFGRISGATAAFNTTATPVGGTGAADIRFSLVGSPVPLSVVANFLLTGNTVDAIGVNSGPYTQEMDSLSFNITARTAFCWTTLCFNIGDSLLSGTALNTTITGTLGVTNALFSGATASGATISYSSPLISFDPGAQYSFNFDLLNMSRSIGQASTALGSFRSTISGTFSSDQGTATFNVPEPGTWSLMIIGMGLVGVARRRRRNVVTA